LSKVVLDDPLWPHFEPLWKDLLLTEAKALQVAGGYGLFLKQRFLIENRDVPIVIPLERWRDNGPRATKDLDLVLSLDLIGTPERHQNILKALEKNDFQVSEKPSGKRWQFVKLLKHDRLVLVELHAPLPEDGNPQIVADRQRVKHKPSLGEAGIHGRTNPEAAGCDLFPFRFSLGGIQATVVNPVTWSVMKLTAMHDRWTGSQDSEANEETRSFAQQQAIKHAQDVCRVIASMTRDESDTASAVCDALRERPAFRIAVTIWNDAFVNDRNPAVLSAKVNWLPEDFEVIQSVGSRWFL